MTIRTSTLQSSVISRVSYDDKSLEMTITFNSGRSYTHYGVPDHVYEGLIDAPSAGQFYNAEIKGQYS